MALERKKQVIEGAQQGIEKKREDKAAANQEQDNQPDHSHAVIHLHRLIGEKVPQNPASVEWRNRNQIEDEQQEIDKYDEIKE